MNKIRSYVENKNIWVFIDETTNANGLYLTNIIIGTLQIDNMGNIFLLISNVLEKTIDNTFTKVFNRSSSMLWPKVIKYDNIFIFLNMKIFSPYMVKAGKAIHALHSKMIHVPCLLAYALHLIDEEVRKHFVLGNRQTHK